MRSSLLKRTHSFSAGRSIASAGGVVLLGLAVLVVAFAAGVFANAELESGTLGSGAAVVSDAGASGGKAVKFAAALATPSPVPSATPTPAVTCSGAQHTAGGPDGAGSCWPGPNNTGVPSGTTLSAYTASCTITTAGTVIDAKTVNCDLVIRASNVMIKRSKVNGLVYLDTDDPASSGWSFTLQDSEADGGTQQRAVVQSGNMTVLRSNVHGGVTSVQCEEKSLFCKVQDSWLHGQYIPDNANWHLGGMLSDGGTNMTITHNTMVCDHAANNVGEGCTGDLNFIPNFAPISGATVTHNLFGANLGSAYCTYGGEKSTSAYPHSNHIVYQNNVFQRGSNNKCAAYGPVTDFDVNQPGNQWTGNTWTDGTAVPPEN